MSTTYKDFGNGPYVTVQVTTKDLINQKDTVRINWSCCGEVSIARALEFYNAFGEAIGFARAEAAKLKLEIDE
jgi:hypothetical protein